MNNDKVEFWLHGDMICSINSSMPPHTGEIVNIAKHTYKVYARSFVVDHSESVDRTQRQMVCTVILKKVSK